MSLRPREARALDEWTALLRERGVLAGGAPIPVRPFPASEGPGSLPDDIGAYFRGEAIVGLSARRCGLESVPDVTELAELETLDLDGNPLARLPEGLPRLRTLRMLSLYGSALTEVPSAIGELARLEYLSLGRAPLTSLPDAIWELQALRTLIVAETRLR